MSEKALELKPCPFCGGEAMEDRHGKRTGCGFCGVWVHRCALTKDGLAHDWAKAAKDWNTRADPCADAQAALDAAARGERAMMERCAGIARSLDSGRIRHHPEAVKAGKAIAAAIEGGKVNE